MDDGTEKPRGFVSLTLSPAEKKVFGVRKRRVIFKQACTTLINIALCRGQTDKMQMLMPSVQREYGDREEKQVLMIHLMGDALVKKEQV